MTFQSGGLAMAVAVQIVLRGVTRDKYDAIRSVVEWLNHVPDGGLAHITWWEGDDCHNADAWESEDALDAFVEHRLGPAMANVGVMVQPEVTIRPAHEV